MLLSSTHQKGRIQYRKSYFFFVLEEKEYSIVEKAGRSFTGGLEIRFWFQNCYCLAVILYKSTHCFVIQQKSDFSIDDPLRAKHSHVIFLTKMVPSHIYHIQRWSQALLCQKDTNKQREKQQKSDPFQLPQKSERFFYSICNILLYP